MRVPKQFRVLLPLGISGTDRRASRLGREIVAATAVGSKGRSCCFSVVGELHLCGPPVTSPACNSACLLFCFGLLIFPLNRWVLPCAKELLANKC